MFTKRAIFVSWIFLSLVLFSDTSSAEISVMLNEPENNYIFNSINNVTFSCNMSTSGDPSYIELYAGLNGGLSQLGSKYLKGIENEDDGVLLMHFNKDFFAGETDTHVYDWSGNGNNGTADGVYYNRSGGRFYGAYEFNGSNNKITVEDSDSLDLVSEGSMEFWINVRGVGGVRDRVMMKGNSWNDRFPYAIYISSLIRLYVWLENSDTEVMSTFNLNYNEWYHIVATWNSSETRLYINGSLDNTAGGPLNMFSNSKELEIGGETIDWDSEGPFNGSVDDLALYSRVLTAEEVSEHYNKNFENVTGAEWNITSLEDGSYLWNCLAYDNETVGWSVANRTFNVDLQTPPSINSINLSPSSDDEIDPGVTINVTANITDVSNVSFVMFQYKECSGCSWVNITMNNISQDEWNTSFATAYEERVYYYRIWSNDTFGHSGYSLTNNLSVMKDYTWVMNSSALEGVKKGMVNTVEGLGVLAINNTGDDSLVFTLADDWNIMGDCGVMDCEVYYNGSVSYQFSLPNKSVEYVNITSLFEDHDSETNLTINISAEPSAPLKTASPVSIDLNITLNSYTGGPYFNVYVISPPATVYQSQTFNLTAKVKNIGNESSTDTWINWTLPAGWNVVSGNMSNNVSTIGPGSTYWNNITVYADPNTATAGTYEIYVNVSCNESVNGSASAVMGISCNNDDDVCGLGCSYVTDDDCRLSSGGTSGVSTVYPVSKREYAIILEMPLRVDVNKGETRTFVIGIKNNVSNTELNNVYLSMSGYPQTFVSINPPYLTNIKYGETGYFTVEVRAPVYAVYGEYGLDVTVRGEFLESGNLRRAEKTGNMLLFTYDFIENDTLTYLEKAKEALEEMDRHGFETGGISEIVEGIENALDGGNYERAREFSEKAISIKELAFRLTGQIQEMEKNVENVKKQNVNLPETEKMLFLAKSAFQRGEYERSGERMDSALMTYVFEMGGANFWIFMYSYWWIVAIAFVASGTGIVIFRRKMTVVSLVRALDTLVAEEEMVKEFIMDAQKEYFGRKMGSEKYSELVDGFENGLAEIRKRRAAILSRLTEVMKLNDCLRILRKEENRVRKLIAEAQRKYFILGKMSKSYYKRLMEGLKSELFEIRSRMDMLEGGEDV